MCYNNEGLRGSMHLINGGEGRAKGNLLNGRRRRRRRRVLKGRTEKQVLKDARGGGSIKRRKN